jgi:thiol-disulfide isomerase/thioredoxin
MKKIIIILALIAIYGHSFAQFKLSGKINNYTGKQELKINIPVVFGFDSENSISIPIDKSGRFNVTLPIKAQKFASLFFVKKTHILLLSQSKNLVLNINETDSTLQLLSGTALSENQIMQKVNVLEYPFFLAKQNVTKFSTLSLAALKDEVIAPYYKQRDQKIALIRQSALSTNNKELIMMEIKAVSMNYLDDLARTEIKDRETFTSLVLEIFDHTEIKPKVFPAGPQYFGFVNKYLSYLETKAFVKIKQENIPTNQNIPYFGLSLDSANVLIKRNGKSYWKWIAAINNLPPNIAEMYGYQLILNQSNYKDLKQTLALAKAFKTVFPKSNYVKNIDANVSKLQKALAINEINEHIKVIPDYQKIQSVYEVIKPFKNKVVYLDVWGTWCGPCKDELKYLPALKSRFKDKDVLFVYLDMDEDSKDANWREFIKTNGLTGIHFRKTKKISLHFGKNC